MSCDVSCNVWDMSCDVTEDDLTTQIWVAKWYIIILLVGHSLGENLNLQCIYY